MYEVNRLGPISGAHDEEYVVAVCKIVEKTGEGAHYAVEGARPISDREVDDADRGGSRALFTVALDDATDRAVDEVYDERILGN
jgi:hypothetical protein